MTLLLPPNGGTDRETASAINAALKGKINSIGRVTLTHDAANTVVKNAFASSVSHISLFPQTAHAAAELGAGTAYIDPADTVDGVSFKITHANNAQTDRAFSFSILG